MIQISERAKSLLDGLAEAARMPLCDAPTLPPELYYNEEIYELEQQAIFSKTWQCAGLAGEIPNPGAYLTFSIGRQPAFCVRGRDGIIRTFSNVCRHRMMVMLEGKGRCGRIVCPYHAWTYDLEGRLIGAAHMAQTAGFEKSELGLPEIRTEVWHGWIYITLNSEAPALAAVLRPLHEMVERYGMEDYIPVVQQDHVWATNWKLLTENFMEGYHLPVAHRQTVGAWMPVETTEFPPEADPYFTYQTFTKDETARYGRAHENNKRLDGRWRYTTVMPTIYPCHMYILAPDHLWYLSLRPKSAGEVQVRFGVAIAPEVYESLNDKEAWVAELVAFFDKVNSEDRYVVEGIFNGVKAPMARQGRLSWLERELHDFAGFLAQQLQKSA